MSLTYTSYRIFLSSPGDVDAERGLADQTLRQMDDICRETLQVGLEVKRWEKMVPVHANLPEESIQSRINKEIKGCHFFVLILNKRYGTIEPGESKSNTEREIDEILKHQKEYPMKKIMAYFRRPESNPDRGPQEKRVIELKDKLTRRGILFYEYGSSHEFQDRFTHDMYNVVMRMILSPYKRECLQRFWRFTGSTSDRRVSIAVVYPPIPREFMGTYTGNGGIWHQRIQPNIYFEDYKAIHKIKKTLKMAGYGSFRVYPNDSLPDDIAMINRVWVCAPRSPKALQSLAKYTGRSRFIFSPRTEKTAQSSANAATALQHMLFAKRTLVELESNWNE